MAVLKGYFDESGKEDDPAFQNFASSVTGCVGTIEAWELIQSGWAGVLTDFEVPYFHMKEYAHSKAGSPFEAWKGQDAKRADFLKKLIGTLQGCELYGVGAIVRHPDLCKFNQEYGQKIEAYPLGIYSTMIHTSLKFPNEDIEFILDKVDRQATKIATARQYAAADNYYQNCGKRIEFLAPENISSKCCIPLQVADFLAYEVLKAHKWKNNYFLDRMNIDRGNYLIDLSLWQSNNNGHGIFPPKERQSFEELLEVVPIDGIIWDYKCLCDAHNARGGSWQAA